MYGADKVKFLKNIKNRPAEHQSVIISRKTKRNVYNPFDSMIPSTL